jgi:hypothetical protein
LDENGLLDCALEIEAIGRRFNTGKMFTDQGAQKNFQGQEGEDLANSVLTTAQAELENLQETLGSRTASDAAELTSRIERQKDNLKTSYEADTRRSIVEEGRAIRQEISKIKNKRENIGEILQADMEGLIGAFDAVIRPTVDSTISERFDRLVGQARESIGRGSTDDARKSIAEMRAICFEEMRKQPSFVVDTFLDLARNRAVAIDKALHDRLIEVGKACIERNAFNDLRNVIVQMLENRYPTNAKDSASTALAGLMK